MGSQRQMSGKTVTPTLEPCSHTKSSSTVQSGAHPSMLTSFPSSHSSLSSLMPLPHFLPHVFPDSECPRIHEVQTESDVQVLHSGLHLVQLFCVLR